MRVGNLSTLFYYGELYFLNAPIAHDLNENEKGFLAELERVSLPQSVLVVGQEVLCILNTNTSTPYRLCAKIRFLISNTELKGSYDFFASNAQPNPAGLV